eukprot:g5547.t1
MNFFDLSHHEAFVCKAAAPAASALGRLQQRLEAHEWLRPAEQLTGLSRLQLVCCICLVTLVVAAWTWGVWRIGFPADHGIYEAILWSSLLPCAQVGGYFATKVCG